MPKYSTLVWVNGRAKHSPYTFIAKPAGPKLWSLTLRVNGKRSQIRHHGKNVDAVYFRTAKALMGYCEKYIERAKHVNYPL